jgi:hypothetical protein
MQLIRKFSPVLSLIVLIVLFIGWTALDWKTTTVVPWAVWLFTLFVCTLSWSFSFTPRIRKAAAVLCALTVLPGILLIGNVAGLHTLWSLFVLAGFAAVHLYLYEIAARSALYKGTMRYVLLIPGVLTVCGIVGLYAWNMSLKAAWVGLLLIVVLAVIGVLRNK